MSSALAIDLKGQSFSHCQKLAPSKDDTLAEDFQRVVLPFSIGQLARAADCSKDTAKAWKAGRAVPSAAKLFRLARKLTPVQDWVSGQIDPSKTLNALIASLQQQALMPGQEGAIARAQLNKIMEAASS